MKTIEYEGTKIKVDDDGYLLNFDDWDEKVAQALAEREGMKGLTKEKMAIIRFIRDYYKEYNFFPILNAICKNVHQPKNCVNEEFMDPLKAWKIAGLPKPDDMIVNVLVYGESPG